MNVGHAFFWGLKVFRIFLSDSLDFPSCPGLGGGSSRSCSPQLIPGSVSIWPAVEIVDTRITLPNVSIPSKIN